jgi:hypothetical protein
MEELNNSTHGLKKRIFKKFPLITIIGIIIGALGGYLYYAKVGCVSGTCAITSNPWISTAWGGAFGYLIFDIIKGKKSRKEPDQNS